MQIKEKNILSIILPYIYNDYDIIFLDEFSYNVNIMPN